MAVVGPGPVPLISPHPHPGPVYLIVTCPACHLPIRVGSPSHSLIFDGQAPPVAITPGIVCPSCATPFLWNRTAKPLSGHTAKLPSPQPRDLRDPSAGLASPPPNLAAFTNSQLARVLSDLNLSTAGSRQDLLTRLAPHVMP